MKSRQVQILSFATILVAPWGASVAQPLPARRRTEGRFSQGLPADRDQAMAEAKRRLADISQSEQDRTKSAFDGLIKALQYGLDRYPAIVFDDGQAVVYGVGLKEAIEHYRNWRATQAQQR